MTVSLDLSQTSLKDSQQLLPVTHILQTALDAVDPYQAVIQAVKRVGDNLLLGDISIPLHRFQRIWVAGAGKAAYGMAAAMVDVLGEDLTGGAIITKTLPSGAQSSLQGKIAVLQGNHPVPGEQSLASTREMRARLGQISEGDIVFTVISGGASALMTDPYSGIPLEDLRRLTKDLLACGAAIHEMNVLRKHLDRVKGGGLVRQFAPARVVSLILSDVPGNNLGTIASGPTTPDASTFADALDIVSRYGLLEKTPPAILAHLERGARGELPETLKAGDAENQTVSNFLVGSNEIAAKAALVQAEKEGFQPYLLTNMLQGEAREAGQYLASVIRQCVTRSEPVGRPACLIAGGETTVSLRGNGLGGRNLELALGAVDD
ncbi:MAG TPA: DUF4147 domain-containing protein, partial [Anaerolineaceae bacterium]|nr:DUF4147 domain-containing protein [Anaerolineaceae bacterium]